MHENLRRRLEEWHSTLAYDLAVCFTKDVTKKNTSRSRTIEKEASRFKEVHYDTTFELNRFSLTGLGLLKQWKTKSSYHLLTRFDFEKTWGDTIRTKGFIGVEGLENRNNLVNSDVLRKHGVYMLDRIK